MPWTYMLKCRDGSYYVGSTVSLEQRVGQHWTGAGSRYVAERLPAIVVYACEFRGIQEAYAHERQLKGWSRAKKEALIRGEYGKLPGLARNHQTSDGPGRPSTGSGNVSSPGADR